MSLQIWLPLNNDLYNQGLHGESLFTSGGNAIINNSGKIGKCYSFNGTNSYLIANFTPGTIVPNEMSFCCWMKLNAINKTHTLFSSRAAVGAGLSFFILSSNKLRFDNGNNSNNTSNQTTFNYIFAANIWYHIAVIQTNTQKKLYINGILQQSINKPSANLGNNTATKCTIGASGSANNATDNWLNGYLNDVRIYDHALSDKEVEEISKGLVLHYKLDNNGMCNPNILTGTYYNSYKPGLSASTTARNIDSKWTGGSGGNGSFSVAEDITCPIGKYSWNILNNTSGNRDFQQGDQPYVSGQVYTTSFWAKGSGTCLYRSWNSTDSKQMFSKTWTLTNNWTYYTYTFTASAEMETDKCTFHLGVTGASSISICGMKMEKGNYATSYSLAIGEMTDNSIIYDSSGYNNNGIIVGNTSSEMFSPKYNTGIYMNNINTANRIEHTIDFLTEQLTISFWVKLIAKRGQVLFAMPTTQCCMNNAGTYFYINSTSDKGYSASTILDDNWNFLTITKNNNLYSFYINGISIPATGSATFWTHNGDKLYILNRNANNNYAAEAFLSDFRIYTTILTEEQIKELYNTSATIDNLGNIHAREFDENSNLNITKTGLFQASEIKDGDYQIASILKNTNSIQGNNLYEY